MVKSVKTIKNMDKKVWLEIKAESAKHRMTMPQFLKKLIVEHKESERPRKVVKSMFGAHPWMTSFTVEDEGKDHEL